MGFIAPVELEISMKFLMMMITMMVPNLVENHLHKMESQQPVTATISLHHNNDTRKRGE